MHVGSIVIQNDVLGVLTSVSETSNTITVRTKEGREITLQKDNLGEVANPYAVAALIYHKVVSKIKEGN